MTCPGKAMGPPPPEPEPPTAHAGHDIIVGVSMSGWHAALAEAPALCRAAAAAALDAINPAHPVEVGIELADDARVTRLNGAYRGRALPTNVLAFPMDAPDGPPGADGRLLLGDVVVALETVTREAGKEGKRLADHLVHLVVHGLLHLSGYDHHRAHDADEMEDMERRILARMGIGDPYRSGQGGEG